MVRRDRPKPAKATCKLPAVLVARPALLNRVQRRGMRAARGAARWILRGVGLPELAEVRTFIGYGAGQFSLGPIVKTFVNPIGRCAAVKLNNAFARHSRCTHRARIQGRSGNSIYLEEAPSTGTSIPAAGRAGAAAEQLKVTSLLSKIDTAHG